MENAMIYFVRYQRSDSGDRWFDSVRDFKTAEEAMRYANDILRRVEPVKQYGFIVTATRVVTGSPSRRR